jgi:hypothetical protein
MTAVTPQEASLDSWRTCSPAHIPVELRAVDRVEIDKETGLYKYRDSKFSFQVNNDSRLFSKSYLSQSIALFEYFEGDLTVLLPRLLRAVETSNCCGLFVPSSTLNRKKELRTVDKTANEILKKHLTNKVKRQSLEIEYKPIMPIYAMVSSQCPYKSSFFELME